MIYCYVGAGRAGSGIGAGATTILASAVGASVVQN